LKDYTVVPPDKAREDCPLLVHIQRNRLLSSSNGQAFMLPKIIRTGIHRYEGTGVRKTEMARAIQDIL